MWYIPAMHAFILATDTTIPKVYSRARLYHVPRHQRSSVVLPVGVLRKHRVHTASCTPSCSPTPCFLGSPGAPRRPKKVPCSCFYSAAWGYLLLAASPGTRLPYRAHRRASSPRACQTWWRTQLQRTWRPEHHRIIAYQSAPLPVDHGPILAGQQRAAVAASVDSSCTAHTRAIPASCTAVSQSRVYNIPHGVAHKQPHVISRLELPV